MRRGVFLVCKNTSVNGGYYKIIQIMIHVMCRLHRGLIYDFVTHSTSSWLRFPKASIAPQPVVCLLSLPALSLRTFVRQAHINRTTACRVCLTVL